MDKWKGAPSLTSGVRSSLPSHPSRWWEAHAEGAGTANGRLDAEVIMPTRTGLLALLASAACVLVALGPIEAVAGNSDAAALEQAYKSIHDATFVDLTHSFSPTIPHWKGIEPATVVSPYTIERDGFHIEVFTHAGQWGTHVDPPAHFHRGLKTIDQIDPQEFLLRLVVIDVHEKVERNPDYVVTLDDVKDWELRHGAIPEGAFVALRTDWSKRWPNQQAMQNTDAQGIDHYPGWSRPVLEFLYETRKIAASGHETTDTDPGLATSKDDYSLESYVLGTNHFQIELLNSLDKVPEAGALVLVAFPKPEAGSGFPARVVAILPKG
jgi:kynurenine formamidase